MKQTSLPPAVVMCTWRRAPRLPTTLQQLAEQEGPTPHLYIWNNNTSAVKEIDAYIAQKPKNLQVKVHHHEKNIGGFGRFMYAKEIASKYPYIIFIDDDQELYPDSIKRLVDDFEPKAVKGWHAFNFFTPDNYWLRLPALRGKRATYIGTCGMIVDSSLFTHDVLFTCPDPYWFIEDLWLCYIAEHHLGWKLRRSRRARFRFVVDTKNQFQGLMPQKTAFLRYLSDQGWKIRGRAVRSMLEP